MHWSIAVKAGSAAHGSMNSRTPKACANGAKIASPLRVAIVGCGAIVREIHLPVLAGHRDVRVVALVDRDVVRAKELASAYKIPNVFGDADELDPKQVDA